MSSQTSPYYIGKDIGKEKSLRGTVIRDKGKPISASKAFATEFFSCGIIGEPGSGKTVMGKTLIEELIINKIPVIAIDPVGDLGQCGLIPFGIERTRFFLDELKNQMERDWDLYESKYTTFDIDKEQIKNYSENLENEGSPRLKPWGILNG